ncbi:MAG TPA: cellulase family glycosylhydrolase, partial [Chryseosolibacter sp.]
MATVLRIGLFTSIALLLAAAGNAQTRLAAYEMNQRLGRGINMGNAFEAPSETAWGNPWQPDYFKRMAQLGFNHVRLPVRWEPADRSMSVPPYTIAPEFLQRIRQVVDTALKYKLHIIINMHHHEALYADPAGQKDRFLSQWQQIADYFKDYPDSLLFEVLNEPHGNLTPDLWNDYFALALARIRETNPTRIVLMDVASYGGLGGVADIAIPDDEYLILTPHYYNPFHFTHQGAGWVEGADAWLGTKWHDTESERETVASEFAYTLAFSDTHHIPVHVGEFGSIEKADLGSRALWTTFLARWFEEHNLSWAYWDFSAGFGIYKPATGAYVDQLVDALLVNPMPEPTPVTQIPVYVSNFSAGTDGWKLQQQGGAVGSLTVADVKLNVSVSSPGTEGWHLQLVKNNIPLKQGKLYRFSFNAVATIDRSLTFYAGRAQSPWDAYSGYNGVRVGTAEAAFGITFTMTSATDLAARLVFDLGKDSG